MMDWERLLWILGCGDDIIISSPLRKIRLLMNLLVWEKFSCKDGLGGMEGPDVQDRTRVGRRYQ